MPKQRNNPFQQRLLVGIYDLMSLVNSPGPLTSTQDRAVTTELNALYHCYQEMAKAFNSGQITTEDYLAALFILISIIDEGYMTRMPEAEFEISLEWGKQRKQHLSTWDKLPQLQL